MSATAPAAERELILGHLTDAVEALERGDNDGWRASIDQLLQWRAQPFLQGLAALTSELGQSFGMDANTQATADGDTLLEACARLEHVVETTEKASMQTLDLLDECRALVATMVEGSPVAADTVGKLRKLLSDMTLAQGFQDTTGQVILRVVELVREVHSGLGGLVGTGQRPRAEGAAAEYSPRGFGPAVPKVDAKPATQDDANDILNALGI